MFQTVKTGLESIVKSLEAKMHEGTIIKGTRIEKVAKQGDGYTITLSNGKEIEADAIVVATSHKVLPSMFAQYKQFRFFRNIPSTSVANVALAFQKSAIQRDINGTGFVVSRNSDYTITACTWTHKNGHIQRQKENTFAVTLDVGDEAVVEQTEEELVQLVLEDLRKTMDITEDPEFTIVSRWKEAMPQYTVGHNERMKSSQHLWRKSCQVYTGR